jgi:cytochrome c
VVENTPKSAVMVSSTTEISDPFMSGLDHAARRGETSRRNCNQVAGLTMLRNFKTAVFVALAMIGIHFGAIAASNGSADEAKAMVEKAVKLLEAEGKDKAFAAINDASGAFVDRDLYVFVLNMEGTTVAHGSNKALIGKSLINMKDSDGKPFIQDIITLAKSSGAGWVDYKWPNPTTKKMEPKSSYVKKSGDVIVGVGIYKG